jgi:glycosyltransferase involved in cell wall biosynthesis
MADQCLEMELDNCTKAHCVLAISQQDKIALVQYFKAEEKISVLSNIHQFKNIVGLPPDKRKDLLFVGGFDHKPNMDAVAYLHQEIMPALWTIFPDLKITIVGSNPTPELLALNESRFRVLGYVEDLEPLFKSSRLFVAPLRYGAGVKGKIGQSLEYGLPVVTTSIGAEGFEFSSITNYSVADDTQQFVECITELISNDPLWVTVQQASDSILAPFSIKTTQSSLLNILGD